jgi:hypothetical protein
MSCLSGEYILQKRIVFVLAKWGGLRQTGTAPGHKNIRWKRPQGVSALLHLYGNFQRTVIEPGGVVQALTGINARV